MAKKTDTSDINFDPGPPKPEEKKERKKRGPNKTKTDPIQEGEDTVEMVDTIQGWVSEDLKFNTKDAKFHRRTVELVVKKYKVTPSEYVVAFHVIASLGKIFVTWGTHIYHKVKGEKKENPHQKERREMNEREGYESVKKNANDTDGKERVGKDISPEKQAFARQPENRSFFSVD